MYFINGNIEEEFIELIELGKKEIQRTLPIIKEKYSNDYVATKQWYCLKEIFSKEWLDRLNLLNSFSEDIKFSELYEVLDKIKEKGKYELPIEVFDIEKYFNKILEDFYNTVKPTISGYNGRIL